MIRCFLTAVIFLDFVASVSFYGPIWSYDDESHWPGGTCQKGGKRQSPIDIRTSDVIKDFDKQFIKYGAIKFVGYQHVLMAGINNGHTIQFSTEGAKSMHPTISGGPLKYPYRLEQLHFHWLSEHSINGVKFPMEIHFVHVRADLKVSQALKSRDGLAILSVFCNVQAELNEDQQETVEEVMQNIPQLLNTGDRTSGMILDLKKLLSPNVNSYFAYLGSLTSPECNEVVVWIIFDQPIYITDAQYSLFSKVGEGQYNFRSLQRLKQHLVFQPPDAFITPPKAVVVITDVFNYFTSFFRNVTRFITRGFRSG